MQNVFLKIFGKSNAMKVLDYLLDISIDVTVVDIGEGTELTRKTVDKIVKMFLEEEILIQTRKIGKSYLYKINPDNPICKKLYEINSIVLKAQERKVSAAMQIPA